MLLSEATLVASAQVDGVENSKVAEILLPQQVLHKYNKPKLSTAGLVSDYRLPPKLVNVMVRLSETRRG